jgi:hypothetical protein
MMTPSLRGIGLGLGVPMGPECEDPSDLDVDLRIIQLDGEGTVGETGSRIHPH